MIQFACVCVYRRGLKHHIYYITPVIFRARIRVTARIANVAISI